MQKSHLSYSFASKLINKSFAKIRYELENPTQPSDPMQFGKLVEHALVHGVGDCIEYAATKTRGAKWEKFSQEIIENDDKEFYSAENDFLIAPTHEIEACKNIISNVPKKVQQLLAFGKKQVFFDTVVNDTKTRGFYDLETDDCIYDIKLTNPQHDVLNRHIINQNWDIQAYLYNAVSGKNFAWICIDPNPPHEIIIYRMCDNRYLEYGQAKFEHACTLFKQFNEGVVEDCERIIDAPKWV